jgi:hypothetical protein
MLDRSAGMSQISGNRRDADRVQSDVLSLYHIRALHRQLFIDEDGIFALNEELYVGVTRGSRWALRPKVLRCLG